jgi:outer membrane lipoprotein LolB
VHRWQAATLVALFLALVTACSSQSRPPGDAPGPQWSIRAAKLQLLEDWQASGKISLRNEQRSESANMTWSQQSQNTKLNLSGPMGFSATTISTDGSKLEIIQGNNTRHYDISSPDAIVRETGWNLPLKALHYWLKGVPAPELDVQQADINLGMLNRLVQAGWTIIYQDFGQFGQYQLPTKIQLEGADTRIRVIIREWTVDAA